MEEITETILLDYESRFLNESKKVFSHKFFMCDEKFSSFYIFSQLINFPLNYVC